MATLITEPGFESGGTGWAQVGSWTFPTTGQHSGAYCARSPGAGFNKLTQTATSWAANERLKVGAWFKLVDDLGDPGAATAYVDFAAGTSHGPMLYVNGAGAYTIFGEALVTVDSGTVADPTEWFYLETEIVSWQNATTDVAVGANDGVWLFDDLVHQTEREMITKAFRTALLADLATVTTANGFQTEVAQVYSEPVSLEKTTAPAVVMFPIEGGSSSIETITNLKGAAVQNYRLALIVRDDEPHTAVENLLDDVRYAVEKDGSSISAVTSNGSLVMENAGVTEWTEILTSEDQHNKWGMIECTVEVQYIYSRTAAF